MLFEPIKLKNYTIKNRVVMPPMCMYSSDDEGHTKDFHIVHYGSRAFGGVGLIIQEATAVSKDGRISKEDLGIWSDDHIEGLKKVVDIIKSQGSIPGIQINHAGRKSKTDAPMGPSAISYGGDYQTPREMTLKDIERVINDFKQAARRAHEAGYDLLEIHGAHGYLIFEFLSPLSNQRSDRYKDGKVFLREVVAAIQEVWPKDKILALRISAYEYIEGGVTPESISEAINDVKDLGIDIIDVSSGGNVLVKIPAYPGYQLGLAKKVKDLTGLPVMGGGLITDLKMAEHAISSNQVDMVYLGRVLLRDPYIVINDAKEVGFDINYPYQYSRGKK